MPMLHDPAVSSALVSRLEKLGPDSPRQWGNMTVDQMLWHVNQFLAAAVGEPSSAVVQKSPIPPALMRFFVIYLPWPRGAPTNKGTVAREKYDVAAEKARCKDLIAKFVARPVDGDWPLDPSFDTKSGTFASKLQAKHLDHHFRQFNA